MDPIAAIALIWMLLPFVLLVLWLRARGKSKRLAAEAQRAVDEAKRAQDDKVRAETELTTVRERFNPALAIEEEVRRLQEEAEKARKETDMVRGSYREKRRLLTQLEKQIAIYDERLSFAELGVYEPHFDFSDSTEYRDAIIECETSRRHWCPQKMRPSVRLHGL